MMIKLSMTSIISAAALLLFINAHNTCASGEKAYSEEQGHRGHVVKVNINNATKVPNVPLQETGRVGDIITYYITYLKLSGTAEDYKLRLGGLLLNANDTYEAKFFEDRHPHLMETKFFKDRKKNN